MRGLILCQKYVMFENIVNNKIVFCNELFAFDEKLRGQEQWILLEFIVLWSGEFDVRNVTVAVLVFVAENLFDEFVLVGQHLLGLFGVPALRLHVFHLQMKTKQIQLGQVPSRRTVHHCTCFRRYPESSSREMCWSRSESICLKTLTGVGPSSVSRSSMSKWSVAPPGMAFPAPCSP